MMTGDDEKPTNFSAVDSALGYLYQVRLASLSSLQRLAQDQTFALYLETCVCPLCDQPTVDPSLTL